MDLPEKLNEKKPDRFTGSTVRGRVRVLIVDDSTFVRKALTRIFSTDPAFAVAGAVGSGVEALEKISTLSPDVVTLDVMMPGMDGLETLKAIMERHPTPVLMLSQLTQQGTELALKALELGAMDFVDKSSAGMMDFLELSGEIKEKVRLIAGGKPLRIGDDFTSVPSAGRRGLVNAVAIGASTGGPVALQRILSRFPKEIDFPILVVQHMPHGFTGPLAKRLDTLCSIPIREAGEGDTVSPGEVLLAPAGLHMTVKKAAGRYAVDLSLDPQGEIHRPSINVLFDSVARNFGHRSIGVILTGMGSDGADGLKAIKDAGGMTFAQDEATSAVFGMPRVAREKGAAEEMLPLTSIAEEILRNT